MVKVLAGLLPGDWSVIHSIENNQRLQKGDTVKLELFDVKGELSELSVAFDITQANEGEAHIWPKLLSEHINKHFKVLQAGRHYPELGIVPSYGENNIFALEGSGIERAQIRFYIKKQRTASLEQSAEHYDYVFPQFRSDYRAGDRVFHPKTGKIYCCKPWPYTEFCRLGAHMDEQYEPGLGKNWTLAWHLAQEIVLCE
ncbi:chitin-binding protein [Pseudoalteromonas tunicata]|uniref:chitin-binding protein n=1 Tax=Pseudoalteromonas tunicata TaxID=314281 RepID=UPI00273D7FEA|nr:chitin-binding protein [Pseudoalteromonas tunicata]MDP4982923.1 chitin-binding protein [Pseudoalteromonas tunicata]MDP5212245.1 chitin-binding protein [Pseudoalteromonas tunicata]